MAFFLVKDGEFFFLKKLTLKKILEISIFILLGISRLAFKLAIFIYKYDSSIPFYHYLYYQIDNENPHRLIKINGE